MTAVADFLLCVIAENVFQKVLREALVPFELHFADDRTLLDAFVI